MSSATPALYALIDRRRDGRPRIVSEHTDPQCARHAADLLRWAGDPVEIVLLSVVEANEPRDDSSK